MILDYDVKCPCGFKAEVSYGREGEERIHEVYSCPACKNLFTLRLKEKLRCPKCKGEKLKQYNPNKKDNISYYKRMLKNKTLHKRGMDELLTFWKKIHDAECPRCGKKKMVWTIKDNKKRVS
jgi:DNA-directed RNA polymerase subunit M/transcription elongation factor TFIIS